jgi:iron complex transport system substrate-binding protein
MRTVIVLLAIAGTLSAQPKRIVSTAPSITETLFALGLGDRVVGVSTYCHYPSEAASRRRIGTYLRPNVEAIIALRPDLVVLQSMPNGSGPQLARMKLNLLEVNHGNLEDSLAAIQSIGNRCGVSERAAKLILEMRGRLDAIRRRTAGAPRRSLVFIVGRNPGSLDGLVAVGKGSYLNELIEIAGGVNALAGTPLAYPKISLESLLGMNPDVLVDMGDMADTVNVTEQHKREVVALWGRYPALKAVASTRVYAVASDVFVVPGPRIVEAARAFERMLHPETACVGQPILAASWFPRPGAEPPQKAAAARIGCPT